MPDTRVNLATSLHRIAADLSEVAVTLPNLRTDQEIERQAMALGHIADGARDGATILRTLAADGEREHVAQVPAGVPGDTTKDHQSDGGS